MEEIEKEAEKKTEEIERQLLEQKKKIQELNEQNKLATLGESDKDKQLKLIEEKNKEIEELQKKLDDPERSKKKKKRDKSRSKKLFIFVFKYLLCFR